MPNISNTNTSSLKVAGIIFSVLSGVFFLPMIYGLIMESITKDSGYGDVVLLTGIFALAVPVALIINLMVTLRAYKSGDKKLGTVFLVITIIMIVATAICAVPFLNR